MICSIILKHCPKAKVMLFGSRSTQQASTFSDYDVAIDCKKPVPLVTLSAIKEELSSSALPVLVDVIDFNRIDSNFQKQILSSHQDLSEVIHR